MMKCRYKLSFSAVLCVIYLRAIKQLTLAGQIVIFAKTEISIHSLAWHLCRPYYYP